MSDPRAGTDLSVLTNNEILRTVSLYYLSHSFLSSVFIYYQNAATAFGPDYVKAQTDAPLLYSQFKYNVAFAPSEVVAQIGNLVMYRSKPFDTPRIELRLNRPWYRS